MNKKIILLFIIFLICGLIFVFFNKKPLEKIIEKEKIEITNNIIKEEDEERVVCVSYPFLGIEEIDNDIKNFIDGHLNFFKEIEYVSFGEEDIKYTLDIGYLTSYLNEDILSFKFNISYYTGGAHGNHDVTTFTYNIKDKNKVNLKDFFEDESFLNKISTYSINQLMKEEFSDQEWVNEGAGPKIENYERFIVTENAFIFYFPPYQVAPYAGGEKQVIVLFNELKDILNLKDYDFSVNKGIYVLSPRPEDKVFASPILEDENKYFLRIEGYLNGNGWTAFEASGGRVELLNDKKEVLAFSNLEILGDWMKIPIYFRAYLFFNPKDSETGTLIFYNDNASGLEENERQFSIPINFE
jgi:hypothetical protein